MSTPRPGEIIPAAVAVLRALQTSLREQGVRRLSVDEFDLIIDGLTRWPNKGDTDGS